MLKTRDAVIDALSNYRTYVNLETIFYTHVNQNKVLLIHTRQKLPKINKRIR